MCSVYVIIFLKIGTQTGRSALSSAILVCVRVRLVTKLELRSPRYFSATHYKPLLALLSRRERTIGNRKERASEISTFESKES